MLMKSSSTERILNLLDWLPWSRSDRIRVRGLFCLGFVETNLLERSKLYRTSIDSFFEFCLFRDTDGRNAENKLKNCDVIFKGYWKTEMKIVFEHLSKDWLK